MNVTQMEHLIGEYVEFISPRVKPNTVATIRHRMADWMHDSPNMALTTEAIEAFRNRRLLDGSSPATIESTVAAVRTLAKHFSIDIATGRKLKIPAPDPDVPTHTRVASIYCSTVLAKWPRRLTAAKRSNWWRSWIAIASWTGFRLGDLRDLQWSDIDDLGIHLRATKTTRHGRPRLVVPMCPMVARHLAGIRGRFGDSVFGFGGALKQLRRELQRFAQAGGVEYVPPHGFRRFAIDIWTAADPVAGQIIQGNRLGVMGHYLNVHRHLSRVATSVEYPDAFCTEAEFRARKQAESILLASYRSANAEKRQLILDVARTLA